MKRLSLGALALLGLLAASCSTPAYENNHWHINSVSPRMGYHFLGYRQSIDGDYSGKFAGDMHDVGRTLSRHLINDNDENPLLPQPVPTPYRPSPPNVEFKVGE